MDQSLHDFTFSPRGSSCRAIIETSHLDDQSHVIVPAVEGKVIRVISWTAGCTVASVLTWRSEATHITGPMPFGANQPFAEGFHVLGLFETEPGQALLLHASAGTLVGGHLRYVCFAP